MDLASPNLPGTAAKQKQLKARGSAAPGHDWGGDRGSHFPPSAFWGTRFVQEYDWSVINVTAKNNWSGINVATPENKYSRKLG